MTEFYKKEDVIAFLNLHCPKDMWEYQIADVNTIKVMEYAGKEQAYMAGYARGLIAGTSARTSYMRTKSNVSQIPKEPEAASILIFIDWDDRRDCYVFYEEEVLGEQHEINTATYKNFFSTMARVQSDVERQGINCVFTVSDHRADERWEGIKKGEWIK